MDQASHLDDCELQAYLDDEIGPPRSEQIAAHLTSCPACRQRAEEWRDLSHRVRGLCPRLDAMMREGRFWASLATHLDHRRESAWPLWTLLSGFVGLAVLVLLVLIGNAAAVGLALGEWGIMPQVDSLPDAVGVYTAQVPEWSREWIAQEVGWLNVRVVREVAQRWGALPPGTQAWITRGAIWVGLIVVAATLFAGLMLFFACQTSKPRSVAGTRS